MTGQDLMIHTKLEKVIESENKEKQLHNKLISGNTCLCYR